MNLREVHESKRFRLVGGLDVSADTLDNVFLDVDICCEMNATTPRDIITMMAEEHPDLKNVKTDVESIQKWRTNLLPHRIVNRTESGEILVLGELGLTNEHDVHELENVDACGGCRVHAKWLQDRKGGEVPCRLVATQLVVVVRLDVAQSTPHLVVVRLLRRLLHNMLVRAMFTIGLSDSSFLRCNF